MYAPYHHDVQSLAALRAAARSDAGALREAATQFEALFLQMVLKSMRDATPDGGLFGAPAPDLYRDMYDGQIALALARRGALGIADLIVDRLEATGVAPPAAKPAQDAAAEPPQRRARAFVAEIWPHAVRAARELDVAPEAVVAQAALETGWGRDVMRRADGQSSFNVFGIKSTPDWRGGSVTRATLEFEDGLPVRRMEPFRAYASYVEAFADYVRVLAGPRYATARAGVHDARGFGYALQSAGFATDPDYGRKMHRILDGELLAAALTPLKSGAELPP
jgi:flagellar protein FlgJ